MSELVTSLQNPTVKLAVSLQQKKHRDETGLFLVEGVRLGEELIAAGWEIEFGLFTDTAAKQERAGHLIDKANRCCRMLQVSEHVFAKAAETDSPQGILFAAKRSVVSLEQLIEMKEPLLMVLDGIQDPGNMGTLLRTADSAGVDGIIVTAGSADPFNGKALRASMGSAFHLPVAVGVSQSDLLAVLQERNMPLLTTALDASVSYLAVDYRGAVAVAFGNEGNGIDARLLAEADKRLHIPIFGKAESLNVAAAAAVVLYEAARQRRGHGFL